MAHRPLLAIPPPGVPVGFGVARGQAHVALRDGRPIAPTAALVRQQARAALAPHVGERAAAALTLQDIALHFALAAPDVDVVLCGARAVSYTHLTLPTICSV
eukprot:6992907-Prymnesium_polylepis.1